MELRCFSDGDSAWCAHMLLLRRTPGKNQTDCPAADTRFTVQELMPTLRQDSGA